ncbi:hypothetical protein B484DRAFT_248899 [Ochromonadaceae sp. CCMP2298]|nr:hypothetical protein B484DRAFT_248899 [Ochromonadaceae sp. CCMP2298]
MRDMDTSLLLVELHRRDVPCDPFGQREVLEVLLAKHVLQSGEQIGAEEGTQVFEEVFEEVLGYTRTVGGQLLNQTSVSAGAVGKFITGAGAFAGELASTPAEQRAQQRLRESESESQSVPREGREGREGPLTEARLLELEAQLTPLQDFDAVLAWSRRYDRGTVEALLNRRNQQVLWELWVPNCLSTVFFFTFYCIFFCLLIDFL